MNLSSTVNIIILIGLGLSGCGSSGNSGSDYGAGPAAAPPAAPPPEAPTVEPAPDPEVATIERFATAASASQEVGFSPIVDSSTLPSCYAYFEYDGADSLGFDIFCLRTKGITMAHLHAGTAKDTGPITASLFNNDAGVNLDNDRLARGNLLRDDSRLDVSFDQLLDDLRNDRAWFNVHTTTNTAGEVRGQVVPTSLSASQLFPAVMPNEQVFASMASPSQEVSFDPVVNGGSPRCTANFIYNGADALNYAIHCTNILDATMAHIHNGNAQQEGGIDATLFRDMGGVSVSDGLLAEGTLTRNDDRLNVDFDTLLARMQQDAAYLNVHTKANEAGEVRGQVVPSQPAGNIAEQFASAASPSQEVGFDPVVDDSMPPACGALYRYNGFDHIDHSILCNRITGVTMAHIHRGSAKESGGVDATLFNNSDGVDVPQGPLTAGRVSRADLGNETFNAMLARMRSDSAYFNAHTQVNEAGEVRGQIAPLYTPIQTFSGTADADQDNFLAVATPSQEVTFDPTVGTPKPACIATMRYDGSNALHFALDCSNIVAVTQAHIHVGSAKEEGGVLAALFGDDNGIDIRKGRLTDGTLQRADLDEGVFDQIIQAAKTDGAYINVHTKTNPRGEVRGQVVNLNPAVASAGSSESAPPSDDPSEVPPPSIY